MFASVNSSAVGYFCSFGIHQLAVGFLIPPHVTCVGIEHIRAGMNVADDALAGRDSHGELVLDGMAGLIAGDRGVGLKGEPSVAEAGIRPGVDARAVVGIDHVARGAAAGAIVAGMIVRSQEVQRRVEEPGFLKTDEHRDRCGSWFPGRVRSSRREACRGLRAGWGCRLPAARAGRARRCGGRFRAARPRIGAGGRGTARLPCARSRTAWAAGRSGAAAALRSCCSSGHSGARLNGTEPLLKSAAPQSIGAVSHHALAHLQHLVGVAARGAAAQVCDAQVAGVDEPNELRALRGSRACRIGSGCPRFATRRETAATREPLAGRRLAGFHRGSRRNRAGGSPVSSAGRAVLDGR